MNIKKGFVSLLFFIFLIFPESKANEIFLSNPFSENLIQNKSITSPHLRTGDLTLNGISSQANIIPLETSTFGVKIFKNGSQLNSINSTSFRAGNGTSNTILSSSTFAKKSKKIIYSGFIQSLGGNASSDNFILPFK